MKELFGIAYSLEEAGNIVGYFVLSITFCYFAGFVSAIIESKQLEKKIREYKGHNPIGDLGPYL